MFSFKYAAYFQNTFFKEHLVRATSESGKVWLSIESLIANVHQLFCIIAKFLLLEEKTEHYLAMSTLNFKISLKFSHFLGSKS